MASLWQYGPDHFDCIYMRQLTGKDFLCMTQEAFRCTKPGGWIEYRAIVPKPRDEEAWNLWLDIQRQTVGNPYCLEEMHGFMAAAGFELWRAGGIPFNLAGCCLDKARAHHDIEGEISGLLSDLDLLGAEKLAKGMRAELGQVQFVWYVKCTPIGDLVLT